MTLRNRIAAGVVTALAAILSGATVGLSAALAEQRAEPTHAAALPGLAPPPVVPAGPAAPKPADPKPADPKPVAPPPKLAAAPPGGLALPASLTVESTELFITVPAETEADDVHWIVVASVPVKFEAIGKRLVLGTPAGAVIHVYAYATVGGKATPPARLIVTVKAPAHTPVAPVAPVNPPVPPDVGAEAERIYVTVVEDPALRIDHPWVAEIVNNRPLRDAFEKAGYTFRVLSVKDPEYARAKLAPYVEAAGGLPALVVQNGKGKVFDPQKLPQTPAAVKEVVERAVAKAKKE